MLEKSVNEYGQEQLIDNFDKIIKIENRFIQVRLIRTKQWKERLKENGKFTKAMPRAKFINPTGDFYYLVSRADVIELKRLREEIQKNGIRTE